MEERREGAAKFLEACSSLMTGKYNTAESGISRVLAEIAASEPLKGLFSAVTKNFNYAVAKRRYLQAPAKRGERGRAYLPTDRREILAFLFCLFVEIDANTVPFDDFLLRYFYVDGSYTASYTLFADRMVRPARRDVRKDRRTSSLRARPPRPFHPSRRRTRGGGSPSRGAHGGGYAKGRYGHGCPARGLPLLFARDRRRGRQQQRHLFRRGATLRRRYGPS